MSSNSDEQLKIDSGSQTSKPTIIITIGVALFIAGISLVHISELLGMTMIAAAYFTFIWGTVLQAKVIGTNPILMGFLSMIMPFFMFIVLAIMQNNMKNRDTQNSE